MLTSRQLSDRGWTKTAINRWLSEPDSVNEYTDGRRRVTQFLYSRVRVEAVEATTDWQTFRAASVRRRESARRAVSTRVINMIEQMRQAEITIVRGKTDAEVKNLARLTHGGNYRGNPGPFVWSNRTARNCIRHNLTNYEQLWDF